MTCEDVEPVATTSVTLRGLVSGDCERLYEWRNRPEFVRSSRTGAGITWRDHLRWWHCWWPFSDRDFAIIERGDAPIGFVEFRPLSPEAREVSIGLITHRGEGFGTAALREALDALPPAVRWVIAQVRVDNPRAGRFFERQCFQPLWIEGDLRRYVYERTD